MKSIAFTIVSLLLFAFAPLAQAESPRVWFDAPQVVAARDVTSREFSFVHPDERLIELRISLSMLLERGAAGEVREMVHRLESTTAGAQAIDYFPKTTLATPIVGTSRVEQNAEQKFRATADIAGAYPGIASGQAHAEYSKERKEQSNYEQLPALELLTASGTVDRGRGVYFKLKPSPRTTLEGAYEFGVVLRVPRTWRAGMIYVTSEAHGRDSSSVGRGKFVVAAYQQGDVAAQQAAQNYAKAEAALRVAIQKQREALERRTFPTPLHKLGMTKDNALPRDWKETVIFRGSAEASLLEKLPGDVRAAVEKLLEARQQLFDLHRTAALANVAG